MSDTQTTYGHLENQIKLYKELNDVNEKLYKEQEKVIYYQTLYIAILQEQIEKLEQNEAKRILEK